MVNRLWTIKKRSEFVRVSRNGTRAKTPTIVVICLRDESRSDFKVGYTASKKVGNAVVRNKAKRRLRSLVAISIPEFPPGHSFVFIATANTATSDFLTLQSDFLYCVRRAKERANAQ